MNGPLTFNQYIENDNIYNLLFHWPRTNVGETIYYGSNTTPITNNTEVP